MLNGVPDLIAVIYAIFDAPVQILVSIFNYEILGVNMWNVLRGLIFIIVILFIVRITKKG